MPNGFIIAPLAISLAGLILILIGIWSKQKRQPFISNALKAEGTIIKVGIRQPRPFKFRRFSEPAYTQVTVEFISNTNLLIRGEIDTNFTLFYSGQYRIGDKVKLLYNPEKPTEFIVTSFQSTQTVRLILIATGLFLLLTGLGMIFVAGSFSFFAS